MKARKLLFLCVAPAGLLLIVLLGLLISFLFDASVVTRDFAFSAGAPPPPSDIGISNLQNGSLVRLQDLRWFYLFTDDSYPFEDWLKEARDKGELEFIVKSDEVFLKKDLSLGRLIRNDCAELYCFRHRLPFEKIPPLFWKGLIGIEDRRYLDHKGMDWKSLLRAFIADLRAMKLVQGGSTLTQQLVKNLFLSNEKSFSRKVRELVYSFYIESKFTKEEILSAYFNEAYWGSLQGMRIKGVYAASLFYFGKRPDELKEYEVSILIGLLKGPAHFHPLKQPERLESRIRLVHNKLAELYLVPDNLEDAWTPKQWQLWRQNLASWQDEESAKNIWLIRNKSLTVFDSFEAFALVSSARRVLRASQERTKEASLSVKAIIGKLDCVGECPPEFTFYSSFERDEKKGIEEEKHQIGSIIKPIIYSIFFDQGKRPEDRVSTSPVSLSLLSGNWSPKEASKGTEREMTLREALEKSRNIPLIRTAMEIGFDKIEGPLGEFIPGLEIPLSEYPSQLLGSTEMSVGDVYKMFKKFIILQCKQVIEAPNDEKDAFFSKSVLSLLSDPHLTTIRHVVGPRLGKMRFFGKTGTSNHGLDNWYVYYDGSYLGVIWLGVEGERAEKNLPLSGSISAFRIFDEFINARGKRFPEFGCPTSKF